MKMMFEMGTMTIEIKIPKRSQNVKNQMTWIFEFPKVQKNDAVALDSIHT